jgi:hypothetical protein
MRRSAFAGTLWAAFGMPHEIVIHHALKLRQTHAITGDALRSTRRREV